MHARHVENEGPNIRMLSSGWLFLEAEKSKQHLFQSGTKNVWKCTPSSATALSSTCQPQLWRAPVYPLSPVLLHRAINHFCPSKSSLSQLMTCVSEGVRQIPPLGRSVNSGGNASQSHLATQLALWLCHLNSSSKGFCLFPWKKGFFTRWCGKMIHILERSKSMSTCVNKKCWLNTLTKVKMWKLYVCHE